MREEVHQSQCDSSIQPFISGEEIKWTLSKMGKGKCGSSDQIGIEVW